MTGEKDQNQFGLFLKELLQEHSMSMRELSERTEIDTATISRIINGKRKANLQHLEKIADSLNIPFLTLFNASSDDLANEEQKEESQSTTSLVNTIKSFLVNSEVYKDEFSIELVEKELQRYKQYVQTEDGKSIISNRFVDKLKQVDSIGPYIDKLKELYDIYRFEKANPSEILLIGSVLIYFIMPVDIIPDYIFPIGYLDDAIAVNIVANELSKKGK